MSPDEPVTRIFLMLRDVVISASMERYAFQFGRRSLLKVAAAVRFSWGRPDSAGCSGFHCKRKTVDLGLCRASRPDLADVQPRPVVESAASGHAL